MFLILPSQGCCTVVDQWFFNKVWFSCVINLLPHLSAETALIIPGDDAAMI
jgi:hypothetical protein